MRVRTESAEIKIPPVILFFEAEFLDSCKKSVVTLFSLASADDFADTGNKEIHRSDGLVVLVHTHVESLDLFRIIDDENRFFDEFFGEVSLVFGLKIAAPVDRIFELFARLFEKFYCLGVCDFAEIGIFNEIQPFEQSIVNKVVEEFHLFRSFFKNEVNDVFDHVLG